MDPRERADAALARARARGAYVVTPDDAVSPMDASSTIQIPRAVVNSVDEANDTMVIPAATARGGVPPQQPGPPSPPQGYPVRRQQTGPHQPVPPPGYHSGHHQPVAPPGHNSGPHYQPVPQPAPQAWTDEQVEETPRQLDGLVPTTQHTQRSSLSRRLDGQ